MGTNSDPLEILYLLEDSLRVWRRFAWLLAVVLVLTACGTLLAGLAAYRLSRRLPTPLAYSPDGRPYPALWAQRKKVLTIEVQSFVRQVVPRLFDWRYGDFLGVSDRKWPEIISRRLRYYYDRDYLKALAEGMVAGKFVESLVDRRAETESRITSPIEVVFKGKYVWARTRVLRTDISARGRSTVRLEVIFRMRMGDRSLENPWGLWITWQQVKEIRLSKGPPRKGDFL